MARFETPQKRIKKGWLRGLIGMMLADRHIDQKELEIIEYRRRQWGLTQEDVKDVVQNPEQYGFVPPRTNVERLAHLFDLISIMTVDRDIDPRELIFCRTAARALGFPEKVVDIVVAKVVKAVKTNVSAPTREDEIAKWLQQP